MPVRINDPAIPQATTLQGDEQFVGAQWGANGWRTVRMLPTLFIDLVRRAQNLFQQRVDVRALPTTTAAGLNVGWVSGDTTPTASFGASTTGNNQTAIRADSNSAAALTAVSASGTGASITSSTGIGADIVNASATVPAIQVTDSSALTNAVNVLTRFRATSTGTAAAGFGVRAETLLESSTTDHQNAMFDDVIWTDATDATRSSERRITLSEAAVMVEAFRLDTLDSATQTNAWLLHNGTLKRVNVGAADSGGSGQRLLTIAN